MKKTFQISHPKKKPARLVEAVRADIKKYVKRERSKELPEGANFWSFDCKFGLSAEEAKVVHVADLGKCIDEAEAQQLDAFYIEILAKPDYRGEPADKV